MARRPTEATIRSMTGISAARSGQVPPGRPGDWVVIHRHGVGEHERTGLILEVLGAPGHERYRVRWDEEHESICYPGSDATIRNAAVKPQAPRSSDPQARAS
jgi:hypothetical protein